MFDTISRSRPRRPAAGTAVSIAVHVLVVGAVVWLTTRHIEQQQVQPDPVLNFRVERKGPPPTAPTARKPDAPTRHTRRPRPQLMQPVNTPPPEAAPAAVEPDEPQEVAEAGDSGDELPSIGSGAIGDGSGIGDFGPGGGSADAEPRLFDETRMTPPQRLSGPDPAYTALALEHEIEGTMAVRCVVTEQGVVRGCRVVRSLPYMDAAVIHALEQRRYTPARIAGRAVAVDYLFQIKLRLP